MTDIYMVSRDSHLARTAGTMLLKTTGLKYRSPCRWGLEYADRILSRLWH